MAAYLDGEIGPSHQSPRNSEVSDVTREARHQGRQVSVLEKVSDASDAEYEELVQCPPPQYCPSPKQP